MGHVQALNPLLDTVADLGDSHVAFKFLRSCFSACRISYTLHVVPSTLEMGGAVLFDKRIEAEFWLLLGGALLRATFL